jgi:DNA-binding beta-propeller fold protein YncE
MHGLFEKIDGGTAKMQRTPFSVSLRAFALLCVFAFNVSSRGAEPVSFKGDVAPLLLNNCLACHGPKKAEGGYRIDTFERVTAAGDSTQPGFVGKDLDGSEAFRRIISSDVKERMPLEGDPLPADQVALLKQWIEAGLPFDGPDAKAPLAAYIPPPIHPAPPEAYRAAMPITAVEFGPDGTHIFAGGYHELTVWDAASGKLVRRMPGVGQRTYAVRFSPDGKLLAVACGAPGKHGEVRLLDADSGELVKVLGLTSDVVFDCAFSPNGNRLATAAADGIVRVFEVSAGTESLTIGSHSDWVFAVAWDADGSRLATASRDKTAKVFDTKTGELLITYNGHNQPVRGVLFHPEGKEVYSAGSDNKLHRWNIADGKKVADAGLGGEAYKLTAGGDTFFVASADNKVRQFQAADQKQVREFTGAKDWMLSTAFHASTNRLAGGSFNGQVFVWTVQEGSLVTSFYAAPGFEPQKK